MLKIFKTKRMMMDCKKVIESNQKVIHRLDQKNILKNKNKIELSPYPQD